MSSLSSAFNSSSTLLTFDFYKQKRPNASEKELIRVGQIATVVLVIVSLAWIPFMKTLMGGGIFHYLQSVQAYISPPIAAVFLFGLIFKWINAIGAITSLWIGFAIGMLRLVLEYLNTEGFILLKENTILYLFVDMNFLHFAILLFIISTIILMLISKLGSPQNPKNLELVTFDKNKLNLKFKFSTDAVLTLILIGMVLLLWVIFSPLGIAN